METSLNWMLTKRLFKWNCFFSPYLQGRMCGTTTTTQRPGCQCLSSLGGHHHSSWWVLGQWSSWRCPEDLGAFPDSFQKALRGLNWGKCAENQKSQESCGLVQWLLTLPGKPEPAKRSRGERESHVWATSFLWRWVTSASESNINCLKVNRKMIKNESLWGQSPPPPPHHWALFLKNNFWNKLLIFNYYLPTHWGLDAEPTRRHLTHLEHWATGFDKLPETQNSNENQEYSEITQTGSPRNQGIQSQESLLHSSAHLKTLSAKNPCLATAQQWSWAAEQEPRRAAPSQR